MGITALHGQLLFQPSGRPPAAAAGCHIPLAAAPGLCAAGALGEVALLNCSCSAVSGRTGELPGESEKLIFANFLTPCSVGAGCTEG